MRQLLTVLCLLFCANSFATQYFFSNSGVITNTGLSPASPWPISKLNFAFLPDDQILFNKGETFLVSITVSRNGTAGHPIIYSSYGSGTQPIITGFQTVSAWTDVGGGVFESTNAVSTLPQMNMVVINGNNYAQGRTPNTGSYYTIATATGTTAITSSSLNSSIINYVGSEVVIRKVAWITDRSVVTAASGNSITYLTTPADNINAQSGWGFFLENDVRTLDITGEWYFNPATKKIRIVSAITPSNVQVSTIDTLVKCSNRHDITFDGIKFTGSNLITMQISSQNVTIQNCTFDYSGVDCIWGGQNIAVSTGFIFQNNTINHTNNNAVLLRSNFTGALIQNNVIRNTGMQEGMLNRVSNSNQFGMGIEMRADNATIQYNEIDSCGYANIEFFGNNITVQYNFCNGATMTLADGGNIYTFVGFAADHVTPLPPYTGMIVKNNICLNSVGYGAGTISGGSIQGQGIYMDDCTGNVDVGNNTVYGSANSGIFLHNTINMNIHDNTLYNNGNGAVWDGSATQARIRNTTFKHNFLVARQAAQNADNPRTAFDQTDLRTFAAPPTNIDSNVYARPSDDNLTFLVKQGSSSTIPNQAPVTFTNMNLAQWVTYSLFDIHSTKSPIAATAAQQFFYYNPTNHDSTVSVINGVDMLNNSYSGTTVLHQFTSLILLATGAQTTPVITWPTPPSKVYGYLLDASVFNHTANTAGSFSDSPPLGTLFNAGNNQLNTLFTPSNGVLFTTAKDSVNLLITPAPETITAINTTVQFNNFPQNPTIITNPSNISTATLFNGIGASPINAGAYAAHTANTNSNYSATPIDYTFTITPKPGTITVTNLSYVYDGGGKAVSVATSDPFVTVTTYDGSPSLPINAGNHTVITKTNDQNYSVKPDTSIMVISQATPTLTIWNPTSPITVPAAIGGSQLNAVWSVAGSNTYNPISGFVPNAGLLTITDDFVPSSSNYKSVLGTTRTITVNQGTTTLTASNTSQFFDGFPKPITVTAGQSGIITILYGGNPTAPSAVGDWPFTATYSSANYTAAPISGTLHILANAAIIKITNYANRIYTGSPIDVTVTSAYSFTLVYSPSGHTIVGSYQAIATINDGIHTGADTATLTIIKANPPYTWPPIANIIFGTALSATQYNHTSSVSGVFTNSPVIGTVLPVGVSQVINSTFTPTDLANYNIINITNTITVTQASASMAFQNTVFTYDGTSKAVQVITNPVNLTGVTITGSPQTNAGSYPISASMANTNYFANPISGTMTINKSSNYTLTWAVPTPIQVGSTITANILNPQSTIAGTFSFNYPVGTTMNTLGSFLLVGTFTPSNPNYNTQTISVSLSVYGSALLDHFIRNGNTIYRNLF